MTTEFNSFDESPLGGFVVSPLGARNSAGRIGVFVILNESLGANEYGGDATLARAALDRWNLFRSGISEIYVLVAHVYFSYPGGNPIWNAGVSWPASVDVMVVGRFPTLEEQEALVERILSKRPYVGSFRIHKDRSLSISSTQVDPTVIRITDSLRARGIPFRVDEFIDPELWLDFIVDGLESANSV